MQGEVGPGQETEQDDDGIYDPAIVGHDAQTRGENPPVAMDEKAGQNESKGGIPARRRRATSTRVRRI